MPASRATNRARGAPLPERPPRRGGRRASFRAWSLGRSVLCDHRRGRSPVLRRKGWLIGDCRRPDYRGRQPEAAHNALLWATPGRGFFGHDLATQQQNIRCGLCKSGGLDRPNRPRARTLDTRFGPQIEISDPDDVEAAGQGRRGRARPLCTKIRRQREWGFPPASPVRGERKTVPGQARDWPSPGSSRFFFPPAPRWSRKTARLLTRRYRCRRPARLPSTRKHRRNTGA